MSTQIAGINIDHVGKTTTTTQKNDSLVDSVQKNFINGVIAGAVGQVFQSPKQAQREMPNTKANIARLDGTNPRGIVLTADKTETVMSSCWGGTGFSHPMDFHYHTPSYEEYTGHKPGRVEMA